MKALYMSCRICIGVGFSIFVLHYCIDYGVRNIESNTSFSIAVSL